MQKIMLIIAGMLLLFAPVIYGQTKQQVEVTATLQSLPMSIFVTDIQMTGKFGGTAKNGVVEFTSVDPTALKDGKFATAVEVLKIDFEPGNNMFNIQVYTANSNEGYSPSKHLGSYETGFWNDYEEANGMLNQDNTDYVAPLLWSCYDENTTTECSQAGIDNGEWGYFKDYYTHIGEGATGLLLSHEIDLSSHSSNGGYVTPSSGYPYEDWEKGWKRDFSKPVDNIAHWVKGGVDMVGYRKIVYGTGGQYYNITMPEYGETTPLTDKTIYMAIAGQFDGKPAGPYKTSNVYVEISSE